MSENQKYMGNVAEVTSLDDVASIFVKNNNLGMRQIPTETFKEGIYKDLPIDSELSDTSENAVKNKVIHNALKDKADVIITSASGTTVTTTDSANVKPKNIKLYGKTEQKQYEGNQLFDAKTSLITQIEAGVITVNDDGSITLNGTFNSQNRSFVVSLKAGNYYFREMSNTLHHLANSDNFWRNNLITITEDTEVSCYINSGTYSNTVIEPMISITKDAELEPYTGGEASPNMNYKQPLNSHGDSGSIVGKVLGKNLYVGRYYYMHYSSSKIYIENENNVIFPYTPNSETRGVCKIIQCKAGEKYTLYASKPNVNAWLGITEYKDINSSFNTDNAVDKVENYGGGNAVTYTAKSNGILLCGIAGKWSNDGTLIHICTEDEEVQVEIGDVATSYEEPYTEQPFTALTPNGFMGLPVSEGGNCIINGQRYMSNIKDYEGGKNIENVYKFRITSDLTWAYVNTTNYKNHNFQIRFSKNGLPKGHIMSNKVDKAYTYATKFTHFRTIDLAFDNTGFGNNKAYVYGDELTVSFASDSEINSLAKWKQFLDGNEVYVEYIVADPIITDLTQEELDQYNALLMNYPNTTVVNDAGAYMEVEYTADVKNYIAKIEKKHEEDIQTLKNAILSLGGNV